MQTQVILYMSSKVLCVLLLDSVIIEEDQVTKGSGWECGDVSVTGVQGLVQGGGRASTLFHAVASDFNRVF